MTTASSPVAERTASASELRLGSFQLGRRIDERPYGRPTVVAMEGVGVAGGPFADRDAMIRCFPINLADPEAAARGADAAMRLRAVRHRSIVPVLEAGVAGEVAFVAEAKPEGISLAQGLAAKGKLSPLQVKRLVDDVAAGLAAAHGAGLRHGNVSPANVWLGDDGSAAIGGFVFGDPGAGAVASDPWRPAGESKPSVDQYQLAMTATVALTGSVPSGRGGIPESLSGVPGVVLAVLRRATAPKIEDRYADLYAFAQAFGESIAHAGADLIAGLWEATSRKDNAMAAIMLEMSEAYAPDHPDLALLRIRLKGGTGGGLGDLSLAGVLSTQGRPFQPGSLSPLLTAPTPEEAAIAALLMPPRAAEYGKSRRNPWVAFAAGTFACVLLLVLAVAFTLAYS